ncbi:MAG: hypothetical protein ABIZ49_13830 [Opitutaceae bacterium]
MQPAVEESMHFGARILVLGLLAFATLRANDSLADARHARDLLGPAAWTRVIRIENEARGGGYPRSFHALIFEAGGLLWFYANLEGTQSFSLHRNRLAEEKADFGRLLRAIEPGFAHWRIVADEEPSARPGGAALPNGCFIESIAALRQRLAQGPAAMPRLLSFYRAGPRGLKGHTVLTFSTDEGLAVIDPIEKGGPRFFPGLRGGDPLPLARLLDGGRVAKARWIPIDAAPRENEQLRFASRTSMEETEEARKES